MNSTTATNAILLVCVGFLGTIASHVAHTPLFGFVGFAAFVLAIAAGVGALLGAVREGFNTPREPSKKAPAEPVKRKRVADPYENVPY